MSGNIDNKKSYFNLFKKKITFMLPKEKTLQGNALDKDLNKVIKKFLKNSDVKQKSDAKNKSLTSRFLDEADFLPDKIPEIRQKIDESSETTCSDETEIDLGIMHNSRSHILDQPLLNKNSQESKPPKLSQLLKSVPLSLKESRGPEKDSFSVYPGEKPTRGISMNETSLLSIRSALYGTVGRADKQVMSSSSLRFFKRISEIKNRHNEILSRIEQLKSNLSESRRNDVFVDSNLDKELTELSNLFLSTLKKMSDFTLSDIHILQSLTDKQKSVESAFRELLFHEFDLKPDTYLTSPVEQCLKLLSPENINNKT